MASQTLQKAADLEIDGTKTFRELVDSGGAFSKALKASREASAAEANAKIRAAKADEEAAKQNQVKAILAGDQAGSVKAGKDVKNAQDERARIEKRAIANDKAIIESYSDQTKAANARVLADKRAAAAADVLRRSLAQTAAFLGALNDIKFDQEQRGKALGNQKSLLSGGNLDFSQSGPQGSRGRRHIDLGSEAIQ